MRVLSRLAAESAFFADRISPSNLGEVIALRCLSHRPQQKTSDRQEHSFIEYSNLAYSTPECKLARICEPGMLMSHVHSQEYQRLLQRLRAARRSRDLTQQDVASKLGLTQSHVSKCESGERRIDVIELFHFAELYNVSVYYFLPPPRSEAGRLARLVHDRNTEIFFDRSTARSVRTISSSASFRSSTTRSSGRRRTQSSFTTFSESILTRSSESSIPCYGETPSPRHHIRRARHERPELGLRVLPQDGHTLAVLRRVRRTA